MCEDRTHSEVSCALEMTVHSRSRPYTPTRTSLPACHSLKYVGASEPLISHSSGTPKTHQHRLDVFLTDCK